MVDRNQLIMAIGQAVIEDLSDRRGIRQVFEGIDNDVMCEIQQSIGIIAVSVYQSMTESNPV